MKYRVCIFDLDGTLADSVESIAYNANRALEAHGFQPNPVENYKQYAGDGAFTMVQRSYRDAGGKDEAVLQQVFETYLENFKTGCMYHVIPYAGVNEMIRGLKERQVKIAVLSNKPHPRTMDVVQALFGKDTFDIIQGMTSEETKKPHPGGAWEIAKQLKVDPEECLYIGDTDTDMQTGCNAHMHTVGVTWGFRMEEELRAHGAEFIIHTPGELLEIVENHTDGHIETGMISAII